MMLTPEAVVRAQLPGQHFTETVARELGEAFAPSNIALIKYWGKRNSALNLPNTDSLSISLGCYGTTTRISVTDSHDVYQLNGRPLPMESAFGKRLQRFLDLIRPRVGYYYQVDTHNSVPTAAGLASSASGFAALVTALNQLHDWRLDWPALSILARLGSGSACRSLWQGFVHWHRGERADGLDSYATPLPIRWPQLRVGLLVITTQTKAISSRDAMQRTVETSRRYQHWPKQVADDLAELQAGLATLDFATVGCVAERNALAMHATMADAVPSVSYTLPETMALQERVWQLRQEGVPVYFTQDAGSNLKLLFLEAQTQLIQAAFPEVVIVNPWEGI